MPPSPPVHTLVQYRDVPLPMRDNTHLATDIYRPAQNGENLPGPFPTLLCRTPYDKSSARYVEIAEFFVPHGYAVVLQDLRGRGRSEGIGQYYHVANPNDGRDGYDTIEWIATQPWSDTKVGMVGSSFAALVQTRAAFERPPHLKAIWPDVTPTNSYRHQAREGGAMQLHMFWALFLHAQDAPEIAADPDAQKAVWSDLKRLRQLLGKTPFKAGQTALSHVPNLEETLLNYCHRGTYDRYWQAEFNDFERHFDRHADVPGCFSGGWYDPFSAAMTGYYAAMAQQNRTPQRLVMGPWTHVGMRDQATHWGQVDFGPQSMWGIGHYFTQQLGFFDQHLKDQPATTAPPVQIFVMGGGSGRKTDAGKLDHGGQWRGENQWPPARTEWTRFNLHNDGRLDPVAPQQQATPLSFTYDPANPVPTIGGSLAGLMELPDDDGDLDPMWQRYLHPVTRLRHIVPPGPAHQKETPQTFGAQAPYPLLADRPDVLVFQTPPLVHPIEITGAATVELWIASSAPDTDFTAKLLDVYPSNPDYPEGFHLNLVDSVIRTRYRTSWEKEDFMVPGKAYLVKIQLPPTSNLFQAGHRIRLDISSSNFPRLELNPNTGDPVGRHIRTQPARNTVFADPERPSNIVLPIIPA